MKKYDFLIVGAGISGCTIAERLASEGKSVLIIDKRDMVGGNCYDFEEDGILVQKYGPHIFHTKSEKVWKYVNRFTKFNNYKHKVLAMHHHELYVVPININTINKFYKVSLKNEEETKEFLKQKKEVVKEIKNSEEVVVSKVGRELFEAFIEGYTKKQWDKFPRELDKSVLERVRPRVNFDDFYFNEEFQGMPIGGFTKLFEKIISNPIIEARLNLEYNESLKEIAKKIIWTGRIDEYYSFRFGKLDFRRVLFEFENINEKNFQENSVINYPEMKFPFNRITEFKKFYDTDYPKTIICKETFSWDEGEIAYPLQTEEAKKLYEKYEIEAKKEKNVYFLGRLARYKYLNMDQCIESALDFFEELRKEKFFSDTEGIKFRFINKTL